MANRCIGPTLDTQTQNLKNLYKLKTSDAMHMENRYIGPTLDAQTQNLKNNKIIKSLYHNIVFLICERTILPLLQILYCLLSKKILFFIAVVIIELSA